MSAHTYNVQRGTPGQQLSSHLLVMQCHVQRGLALLIHRVHVSASGQQAPHHLHIAPMCSSMQGGGAVGLPSVWG